MKENALLDVKLPAALVKSLTEAADKLGNAAEQLAPEALRAATLTGFVAGVVVALLVCAVFAKLRK